MLWATSLIGRRGANGFVECEETKAEYGRDVFLPISKVPSLQQLDTVVARDKYQYKLVGVGGAGAMERNKISEVWGV